MAAVTETEATARAALVEAVRYDVYLDLTAAPVRSRTEMRFGCRAPGAATFADLTTEATRSATLNGRALDPPAEGRLHLPELAAQNVLVVEADVGYSRDGQGLVRVTDQADGAIYLDAYCYPRGASDIFCCFDQLDLSGPLTLSVAAPAGWECVSNGAVVDRPPPAEAGLWKFAAVPGMRPYALMLCTGPYEAAWRGTAAAVSMSVRRRRSLAGTVSAAALARFGDLCTQAVEHYERTLGIRCPYPKYDILFAPEIPALAASVHGVMQVNESLLTRLADPDDDFIAMVAAHEVAHLWFGCLVACRWWDDLWVDEAMATYMSYTADVDALAGSWTAFCYREKAAAYRADELPSRAPVSSPVASSSEGLARPAALTYSKGASVIRQLAALIGSDTLRAGLTEYLRRFAGNTASLDDLIACVSQVHGADLSGWAGEWLRTEGASTLRPELTESADGRIESLAVLQELPRTHQIRIGLYDQNDGGLRRRCLVSAQVSGLRTEIAEITGLAGQPRPDVVVLNDGDLSYAKIGFDERSFRSLARVAMDVGDPLTEAVCWNAAWHMVGGADLAPAAFADLVIRRLRTAAGGALPIAGITTLIDRAVRSADVYAAPSARTDLRTKLAASCEEQARRTAGPSQRVLATGFAASAASDRQLGTLRGWLAGTSLPDGLTVDTDLHGQILATLAAAGLATDDDLDRLVAADPVGGERKAATYRAMRPDARAKETAWRGALAQDTDWQLAAAYAEGIWVPGQHELMAGYVDRYFTEALPVLDRDLTRPRRKLARQLYPGTLVSAQTIAAGEAALAAWRFSDQLRTIVLERQEMLRSVLAVRAAGG